MVRPGCGPTPLPDLVQLGIVWALSCVYSLIAFAGRQTRLSTLTGGIDLAAEDFFGDELRRKTLETDGAYLSRFLGELFAPSNTHPAIFNAVKKIAGADPRLIRPWRPDKTGPWDGGPCAIY